MKKKFLSIFTLVCILAVCDVNAQEYGPNNPYKPTPQKLEQLKQIIPAFPEQPPMAQYTANYQEKYMVSNHPPGLFKYYVHVPENYNPQTAYPALLLLHGGARHMHAGEEYFKLGLDKTSPAIVIVPIAPPGYDWNSAAPLALEALQEVARNYKLDPKRIYLTGYSMGGIGVYSMLGRYHSIFAGAFSACGTYDPQLVSGIDKSVPLLIWHGQKDQTFPVKIVRDIHGYLKASGHDVAYIEQADAGHSDCINIYQKKGFWNWLLEQKKP